MVSLLVVTLETYHLYDSTYVAEFPKATPIVQQSLARILGVLAYRSHPHGVLKALDRLLDAVDRKVSGGQQDAVSELITVTASRRDSLPI